MTPHVSIVVAIHNGADTLTRALQSIADQTYSDWEVILVDDGSTDATGELLQRCISGPARCISGPDRCRIITNIINRGQTKALNQGILAARGVWIARLDADDWWAPDKLTQQMNYLAAKADVGLLGCAWVNHYKHSRRRVRPPLTDSQIRRRIWWRNPFGHSCVVIQRDLLQQVGGYDESIRYSQDLDLWFRLLPLTTCANLPAALCHRTAVSNEAKQRAQMRQTLKTLIPFIRRDRPALPAWGGLLEPWLILNSRWLFPALLIGFFFSLQLSHLSYGTTINDLPYILEPQIHRDTLTDQKSELQRTAIVAPSGGAADNSLEQGLLRFKLYSVDADEMVNLMALSRIKPSQRLFDPHFYMYGGAYLYPLGLWYAALVRLDIINMPTINNLLTSPDLVDQLYILGRLFVLTTFSLSAIIVYLTAREFLLPLPANLSLSLYLILPMTVMQSLTMKPHWYALLPAAAAFYYLTRLLVRHKWSASSEIFVGLGLGLAVGSAATFAPLAAAAWLLLLVARLRQQISSRPLLTVPLLAAVVFGLTNPYIFLNWAAYQTENAQLAAWYQASLHPAAILDFIKNSFWPGFGAAGLAAATIALVDLVRRSPWPTRMAALFIWAGILLAATATASVSFWHTNTRFIAYLAPVFAIYLAARLPIRLLAAIVVLTLIQSIPHFVALADENNPANSTRLQAAAWINSKIPASSPICTRFVPYDAAPFNFALYPLNTASCRYLVRVEREQPAMAPPNTRLAARFTPRFIFPRMPLVTNHVNPQISIYENMAAN